MIIAELEKHKARQKEIITGDFGLTPQQADSLLASFDQTLAFIIQRMKEGKSAHEKFFSDIILNSIDAIIGFDNNFKVFLWNNGAERMFGYKKEEVMGNDFEFLIPPYLMEKGEKDFLINEVREKGFLENYETVRVARNGIIINVSISRFEIYDEHNEPMGSVGILRDITAVKNLQKELREKENLALIGEVVSSIAHSLSNPLNIISGNADFLMMKKKPEDAEYEELKIIVEETTRITRSIRHLLNFSRPFKINRSAADLNSILTSSSANMKYIIGNKDISIKKTLARDLPEILIDKAMIEEVMMNIIANSIQAISKKGEVRIKSSVNGGNIDVEISDNGQGIAKENIEKIFMPFFSSKEYGKGTGLGLSIAKRVIQEHGGSINVKSTPGKGTVFKISLPF